MKRQRKKKIEEPVFRSPAEPEVEVKPIVPTEPEVEEKPIIAESSKKPKPSDIVKVKVLVGTLSYEGGTYEKGETFTVARKRLEGFDSRFFQIVQ